MSEQQQYYDGPGWNRENLESEVEERYPGEYFTKALGEEELRSLLIALDRGNKELLDNTVGMVGNRLARRFHELGKAMRAEAKKMARTIREFQKAIEKQDGRWQ